MKEAKCDIVALLNDDITVPENFCTDVVSQMTPDMGIVGFDGDFVEVSREIMPPPEKTEIKLQKQNVRNEHFGIAMFFYKQAYVEIPDEIKIVYGDDWIFKKAQQHGKCNYIISGQRIYHFYSMSTSSLSGNSVARQDEKLYTKMMYTPLQRLFRIEPVERGTRIIFFGIKITCRKKRD